MVSHPEELLAEYVDGTLEADRLVEVEDHLSRCDRCRDEVALAGRGRAAVAGLPEVEPPPGIPLAVRRRVRGTGRWSSLALRAGGTAAAAALVGVLVWTGISSGPGEEAARETGAPAADGADRASPAPAASDEATLEAASEPAAASAQDAVAYPLFRVSESDHDPASLGELTRSLASQAERAIEAGFPGTARDFYAGFDLASLSDRAGRALSCVTGTVAPERSVVPFVIEEASFQDTPAYVASFLQGPEEDEPYDRMTLVAVSREGCAPLHYAFQRL